MDAVEAAVRNMEDNPIFNAGHGCALTDENTAELDAFIMDGHNLATGYKIKILKLSLVESSSFLFFYRLFLLSYYKCLAE